MGTEWVLCGGLISDSAGPWRESRQHTTNLAGRPAHLEPLEDLEAALPLGVAPVGEPGGIDE